MRSGLRESGDVSMEMTVDISLIKTMQKPIRKALTPV